MVIWGGDSSKFYLLSKNNPWRYICSAIRVLQSVCWRTLVSSEHLHTAVYTLTGQYSQTCHNIWNTQLVMYSTALLLCQGLNSTCCYIHCLWFVWEAAPTYLGWDTGQWTLDLSVTVSALCCVAIAVSVYTEHREVESDSLIRYFPVLQNFPITSHWVQKLDKLHYLQY